MAQTPEILKPTANFSLGSPIRIQDSGAMYSSPGVAIAITIADILGDDTPIRSEDNYYLVSSRVELRQDVVPPLERFHPLPKVLVSQQPCPTSSFSKTNATPPLFLWSTCRHSKDVDLLSSQQASTGKDQYTVDQLPVREDRLSNIDHHDIRVAATFTEGITKTSSSPCKAKRGHSLCHNCHPFPEENEISSPVFSETGNIEEPKRDSQALSLGSTDGTPTQASNQIGLRTAVVHTISKGLNQKQVQCFIGRDVFNPNQSTVSESFLTSREDLSTGALGSFTLKYAGHKLKSYNPPVIVKQTHEDDPAKLVLPNEEELAHNPESTIKIQTQLVDDSSEMSPTSMLRSTTLPELLALANTTERRNKTFLDKAKKFLGNEQTYREFVVLIRSYKRKSIHKDVWIRKLRNIIGTNAELMVYAMKMVGCRGSEKDYFNAYPASATPVNDKVDTSLNAIFEKFRDTMNDDKDIISIEGTMAYLLELDIDLEDVSSLIPLEIIHAPALGEMSREEFIKGWKNTGGKPCDTIAKQQAWVKSQKPLLSTDLSLFKRVYKHTFISSKERGQKAIPLDNAIIYWQMLFSPSGMPWVTGTTNWLALWVEFLQAGWKKSVNKDMWNMTLEFFCKTIQDEEMSFWSEDGAWPGVIDDFVGYVKEKRVSSGTDKMETD